MDHLEPARFRANQVYESIRDAICVGRFLPGERMAEEALARLLDVSRQPVHQALQQLHKEGFLCETGRRGLVVAPVNMEMAQHVFDLRAALDASAAATAARRATGNERRAGEDLLMAGRRALADRDIQAMIQADFGFHSYIYDLSGNPLIANVARMNWHHVRRLVTTLSDRILSFVPMWDQHDTILSAVVAGDAEAAERLARDHATSSIDQIKTMVDDTMVDPGPVKPARARTRSAKLAMDAT
jgi:DNA-binding GntR family transcriptional regulator